MAITSPRMGSGNRTYPYKRKLKPGNPPAKAKLGIKVMQDGGDPVVDPLDQEVLDWTKSYVSSPKYKQRLSNFYKYPDVIQRRRSEVVGSTKFNPVTPQTSALTYYSAGNDISVGPLGVKDIQTNNPKANPNLVRQQIVSHELGHATNAGEVAGSQLNTSEQNYILSRNRNITSEQKQTIQQGLQEGKRFSGSSLHDLLPSESKSDIDATRFLLNKAGIYDARTQDLTPELLKKAKQSKVLQSSPVFKRLQENFDDQGLLDILNKVALNTPSTATYAQDGTEIQDDKIKGPIGYLNSYYNSGMFRKRAGKNADKLVRAANNGANNYKALLWNDPVGTGSISFPDPAFAKLLGLPGGYNIFVSNPESKHYGIDPIQDTLPHEYTHTTRGELTNEESEKFTSANKNKRAEKLMRDYRSVGSPDFGDSEEPHNSFSQWAKTVDLDDHDLSPDENYADLNALRYMMFKQGIYDSRKRQMTKEDLEKAKKDPWLKKQFGLKRLLNTFKDEDIIKLNNEVAYNNDNSENNNTMTAKYGKLVPKYAGGGLSRAKDYGSKEKPYPSVSKGDFAGGGRSYPIPTRADAIDALRLAGLHGRSDVRAKVFKKYPDLKKEFGGEIFEHDANKVQNIWYPKLKADDGILVQDPINDLLAPKGSIDEYIDNNIYKQGYNSGLRSIFNGDINEKYDAIMSLIQTSPSIRHSLNVEGQGVRKAALDVGNNTKAIQQLNNLFGVTNHEFGGKVPEAKKGIYIKPENRGKFNATKKRTGKSTEELTHSKNPKTRKRAIFAQNAKKWHKGEYGLEVMDDGGVLDPNDPMFAQQLQDLIRNNPDMLQSILSPASGTNPPGTGQEVTGLQSQVIGGESVDANTNAQQNKPKSNRPKVNFPSINVGDAVSMGVQGLDLLATEYIDAPRKRANQMRLLRQQLAPVISKPSTGGFDMPVLAKSGIQINSAYTNPVGLPSPTKPKRPFGNVANNFKVDDPNFANVLAEGGEFLELPDGQTSTINGDLHSDYSGGEFMNLPEGAKIYSDSIKVDKTFQKDLTGSGSGKKKTVAQIAKKFNTDHEEDILKDPTSDTISKRSANIMKTFKQSQLQQLFDYQESVKDPLYMINKEQGAQDYLGSEDTVVAKKGVKVMQEGGQPPRRRRPVGVFPNEAPQGMYTVVNGQPVLTAGPQDPTRAIDVDNTLPNGQPWWNNIGGANNNALGVVSDPYWWMKNRTVEGVPPAINIQGQMAMLQKPTSTPKYTTPDSTPELPNSTPLPPVGVTLPNIDTEPVTPPELQTNVPPTTIVPGSTPIDPTKPRKPMPDNNKVNPPRPNPKTPWSNTINSFGEIVPELSAYIQNETDFPVFTARYQPKYLNPVELNIQASLNKNYAQTAPLLEGSSGNPSVDNARAAQALANLYDANNEVFQQKFNFDTQNRYQTDATNLQIENQANLYNLQRADDYWNKITARQAVKEATRNNIMNSAYAKFKKKQLENRSLQLTNQMFDNFKYDPQQGVYFTPSGDQYIFHEPSGNFINIGTSPGDGVETTRTTRNTPKGTTTTIRQKEKKGS